MTITSALRTVDSVLQLEPEELAPHLLEHLATSKDHLHPGNFFNPSVGTTVLAHYQKDDRVEQALREASSWLEREGPLVRREYGCLISRRRQRLRGRQDFEAFHRSNILPRASLHPEGLRLPSLVRETLDAFVRGVRERLGEQVADIRLFGSYARGEAREDSDVDCRNLRAWRRVVNVREPA